MDPEKSLGNTGEHNPNNPFFTGKTLGTEGEPLDVADTDELLGDVLALDE